jgi:hypothetical protein
MGHSITHRSFAPGRGASFIAQARDYGVPCRTTPLQKKERRSINVAGVKFPIAINAKKEHDISKILLLTENPIVTFSVGERRRTI